MVLVGVPLLCVVVVHDAVQNNRCLRFPNAAQMKSVVLEGEWTDIAAGGCDLHPTWRRNPRFVLRVGQPLQMRLCLTPMPSEWKRNSPLAAMPGLYLLAGRVSTNLRLAG